jgi:ABC-2 type transport system ATP-binding protein
VEPVIKLENVTKRYGTSRGVVDVDLEVGPGAIFGFLGPNGAGKTTTISMLVDLIRPTKGTISLFGLDSVRDSVAIRRRIGYLSGDMALDKGLTGWQQLEFFGNLRGNYDKKRVAELAERLDCRLERKFKELSRGNKQKVGLIAALMHDPELLILDEPTSGLDPLVQAEFNKIILEHKERGKTTFISSHVLSEVQEICDLVTFIREGRIIATKRTSELAAESPKQFHVIAKNNAVTRKALQQTKGVQLAPAEDGAITGTYQGDVNELLTVLAKHKLTDFSLQDADLEASFMRYYEQGPSEVISEGQEKKNA